MPEISEEERIRRQQAVDFGRGSIQLSGGSLTPDPEFEALNERFINGELSGSEHIEAVLAYARSLPVDAPAGAPVQEYFTSFDEAMNARLARERHDGGSG